MARVKPVLESEVPEDVSELFKRVHASYGSVPNIFKAMGNSHAVLKGFLDLNAAFQTSSLAPALREKIALAVGQINNCRYCLAAHSHTAHRVGLSEDEITKARTGEDLDPKTAAVLHFVRHSVENRGWVTDEQMTVLRSAGIADRELVEIVMAIGINLFTNYFTHIANPEVDFPPVKDL